MADLDLALIVSAVDQATRPLQRIGQSVSDLGRRTQQLGTRFTAIGAAAIPRLTLPIAGIGGAAVAAYAELEQLEVAFGAMVGNAEEGKRIVDELAEFAATTPFSLTGLGNSARQLLAIGTEVENLQEELRLIGDIAAGSGKPIEELMAVYAKVMAKGKADTEAINQLTDRGIPIVQALIDVGEDLGKTYTSEDIYKFAADGSISAEEYRMALEKLTEEGAIYNDMMAKQSQTISGLASTLKDNVFNALAAVGEKLDELFNIKGRMQSLIDTIGSLTERFVEFSEENPEIVKLVVMIAAAAAAAGPFLIGFGLALKLAGVALAAIGALISVVASPVVALGLLFAGAAWLIYDNWEGVVAFFENVWAGIEAAFPDTAAFFEGIWSGAMQEVPGIFDWVRNAWDETMAWLSGPADGQSPLSWLQEPVTGLFTWVEDAWNATMEAISGQDWAAMGTDIGASIGDALVSAASLLTGFLEFVTASAGAIDWGQVGASAGAVIGTTLVAAASGLSGILTELTLAVNGIDFAAIGTLIGTLMASHVSRSIATLTNLAGNMLLRVRGIDFREVGQVIGSAVWSVARATLSGLAGLLDALVEGVGRIDFQEVGQVIGVAVQTAIVGAISLVAGLLDALGEAAEDGSLFQAAASIGQSILDGIMTVLGAITDLIVGLVTGVFDGIDWLGFVPDWARRWIIDDGDVDPTGQGPAAATVPLARSGSNAALLRDAPASGSHFAKANVGGEIVVRIPEAPVGTQIESVTSENENVPVTGKLGFAGRRF